MSSFCKQSCHFLSLALVILAILTVAHPDHAASIHHHGHAVTTHTRHTPRPRVRHTGHHTSSLMRKELQAQAEDTTIMLHASRAAAPATEASSIVAAAPSPSPAKPSATPPQSQHDAHASQAGASLAPPRFTPKVHICDRASVTDFNLHRKALDERPDAGILEGADEVGRRIRQLNNMRALRVVKRILGDLNVPMILLSGMLLGWQRGCLAIPGDPDGDIGIYGVWLSEAGIDNVRAAFEEEGHELDSHMCPGGPLQAGCEYRVSVDGMKNQTEVDLGGKPYIDINVLYSPPPQSVGGMPGSWEKCSPECGEGCADCSVAYSIWGGSTEPQGRFYPCPIPLSTFELVVWMNQTFWAPANVTHYLTSEYGKNWRIPGGKGGHTTVYRPCHKFIQDGTSFAPYAYFIRGVPEGKEVMSAQREAERAFNRTISDIAAFEADLWNLRGREDPFVFQGRGRGSWEVYLDRGFWPLTYFNIAFCVMACKPIVDSWLKRADGPTPILGLRNSVQVGIFLTYVALSCAHMFLQSKAGGTGYDVTSAVILIYVFKCVIATGMFFYRNEGGVRVSVLLEPASARFGGVPLFLLPLIPGCLLAFCDTLSFVSLQELDPVTYQVFLHIRLILIAILWQLAFKRKLSVLQWFALSLFAVASTVKAIDQISTVGDSAIRGICILLFQVSLGAFGNIASEFLLKELPIPTDLLNACMYFEGLVVLLVSIVVLHAGDPSVLWSNFLAPEAWQRLFGDPWMVLSICSLVAFGIVTSYFLKELSNVFKELSGCFVIVLTAVTEWCVLGISSCTALGVQSVILAALAVGVYNSDPLAATAAQSLEKQGDPTTTYQRQQRLCPDLVSSKAVEQLLQPKKKPPATAR